MAVERISGSIGIVAEVPRIQRRPLCAALLRCSLIALTCYVLFFVALFGGRQKLEANSFVSPWDTSMAPPAYIDPSSIRVETLPKALIIPKAHPVIDDYVPRRNHHSHHSYHSYRG